MLRDAACTLAAVLLAFAALDDITTDRDSNFVVERVALVGCGLWMGWLALRFLRRGRPVLGASSLTVVLAAAVAQPFIGQDTIPDGTTAYLVTLGALAWFLLLSGTLTLQALQRPRAVG
jgi:hypothetical protein